MTSTLCSVDFKKKDAEVNNLYNSLLDCIMNAPEDMTVATLLGVIEMLKFNLINNSIEED